jgi:hypothetical protein
MSEEANSYMIMGMVMLVITDGTMNVIIALRVVMAMVVVMVMTVMVGMRMSMAMRMSVVRMTAHCYHSEQIDRQAQSADQK